jgi:hypothetical protein
MPRRLAGKIERRQDRAPARLAAEKFAAERFAAGETLIGTLLVIRELWSEPGHLRSGCRWIEPRPA